jgi:sulfur carrier protein ThiS
MITVYIARMGHDEIVVEIAEGSTVQAVFRQAGLTPTGREQAFVEGLPATMGAIVEDGDVISIVTPKQAA